MEITLVNLLIFGIFAGLANVLGGLILFPPGIQKNYKKLLKYILALGAGFMLAVTFIDILPEVVGLWQKKDGFNTEILIYPMGLLLVGYLITQFFEHTIAPHFHLGEEMHADHLISVSSAYTAIGGLLIHTFFDGVSIAAAAQVDYRVGILVFFAVFLHKFPEGFTIASMILAAGKGFKEVMFATSSSRSDDFSRRSALLFHRDKNWFHSRLRASAGERRNALCGGERLDTGG